MRIVEHPVLKFERGNPVHFWFNHRKLLAYENETIAAALSANCIKILKRSINYKRPRGFFCGIGKCSSCLMKVDGVPNVRTCITPVKDKMVVEYQSGKGGVPALSNMEVEERKIDTEVAVVGGGPAGLSAALCASGLGVNVVVIDENPTMGGQLIKQTHRFFGSKENYAGARGITIAQILLNELGKANCEWITNASVIGHYHGGQHMLGVVQDNRRMVEVSTKEVIIATGAMENMLAFPNNDLPGVCGAGGVQTLMNVYGVKPGDEALMVGAGNVGLIVGYQMLQAGVNVKAVVEAMPTIGGYLVHASKLRRMGVPILTSHTIKQAIGKEHVEGATIVKLDEKWQSIEGTEQYIDVDLICIAVGLSPSSELLSQAGCRQVYVPELGGHVAIHDENLETTISDIYVAGDASGIEEATTAMMEGKVAGANAALKLNKGEEKAEKIKRKAFKKLELFRASPFSERVKKGKEKVWALMREEK